MKIMTDIVFVVIAIAVASVAIYAATTCNSKDTSCAHSGGNDFVTVFSNTVRNGGR